LSFVGEEAGKPSKPSQAKPSKPPSFLELLCNTACDGFDRRPHLELAHRILEPEQQRSVTKLALAMENKVGAAKGLLVASMTKLWVYNRLGFQATLQWFEQMAAMRTANRRCNRMYESVEMLPLDYDSFAIRPLDRHLRNAHHH
jgi:hypothetical protein